MGEYPVGSKDIESSQQSLHSAGRRVPGDRTKTRHGVSVSAAGWVGLESVAGKLGLSISELLEQIGRARLVVLDSRSVCGEQSVGDIVTENRMLHRAIAGIDPWPGIDQAWQQGQNFEPQAVEDDVAEALREVREERASL
ncbi:hypothetical protein [Gloeobacter morelensis]|uniref:Uncharacterized protein n=1 Tax=Gloeobacter morelensis MG652769 TaxID=2781736 RepID=A0ABY3PJG1_9CYAN|nr:hypothetical protein [Gloeobacter morelensis]UFP93693.1 hypothetical protein ISF26_18195 [Gloeobacter morelensis MG652769]